MIQFKKVYLHGFKSFVEKTEFDIASGMTGIVGPNGCGKSNLVEALRWSMGENSSKRMRGGSGSMEDVIFNGTANRPARNMAEVVVLLDNTARTAPAPFNDSDEIEVVRRIERDHGSTYKINGKTVRARDVQLLYADLMSGANSPYLISQGKITTIIQAKPHDRRQILEEAAGITGLYARRHEAELRLRATDANLKRLEDLAGGMEERLNGLKKQARQAAKYRNLSAQIRQLEVMIASLEWRKGHEMLHEVDEKFGAAESQVAEHLLAVSQLTKTQNVQSQDLPELRQKDAEFSAALQTLRLAQQRLEDEQQRITAQSAEFKAQLERAGEDSLHEKQVLEENTAVLERLTEEERAILERQDGEDEELVRREQLRNELREQVTALESVFTAQMEKTAADRATRQSLENQISHDNNRLNNVKQRFESVREQLAARKVEGEEEGKTDDLRAEIEMLEAQTEKLRATIAEFEQSLKDARHDREEKREALRGIENRRSKLQGEIGTLESVVKLNTPEGFRPVFDDIRADEGFEIALSRALGDTLMASTDDGAPVMWTERNFSDLPALPAGVAALQPHVKAPKALALALSQIGFAENDEDGKRIAADLKAGQSIVSRSGAYWRWDGLHIKSSASDRHAVQLKQKNQLAELQGQFAALEAEIETARNAFTASESVLAAIQEKLSAAQGEIQGAESSLRGKRIELNRLVEAQAGRQAALAKLEEALSLAENDMRSLEETIGGNRQALGAFDDKSLEEQQAKIDAYRGELSGLREKLQEAIREFDMARQEQGRRKARLQAIGDERVNLQNRCIRAGERLKELDERGEDLAGKIEGLKKRPVEIKEESEILLTKTTDLEKEKSVVSDKLATVEGELAETTKALKEAEARLAEAKELRAYAMATREERTRHLEAVRIHIQEQFNMSPEDLGVEAALDPENMPDLDQLKQTREKNVRDRDNIGPVNLMADQEAENLERELGGIMSERGDLTEAVNELRQGIQKLNKEARERLQAAFEEVNGHFKEMFTRLFGGGQAHLSLIESDDPLEAGLEIFAQPPGKALQSLSLLSGGEQTLTAVALIFAMFLTNSSPICVMDEVDAPLDDANVDRFCDLLQEFSQKGKTRFILITHHRLTMARMDRLYGVTMTEKGVSQLVSVDMNKQLDFLEAAE